MKTYYNLRYSLLAILYCMSFGIIQAQEEQQAPSEADALAKQLQNPVANLISVPFQFNLDFGMGPEDGTKMLLNVQPVVPLGLTEDWNLIMRVILPVIWQNDIYGNSGSQFGLGDAVISGFFSPKEPTAGGLIWGVGPVLLVPTATDNLLGLDKFGVGPTAVFLKQAGSLTLGLLTNHIWSVSGSGNNDVNATFIQPFMAKNFPGGVALTLNTEFTQDWDNDLSTGTFHIVGSKVVNFGSQMAQVFLGPRIPYGNGNSADFGVRFGMVLLFPK